MDTTIHYNSKKINWIYIVDEEGTPIFIYESYIQGAKGNNFALISHFLSGIKNIADQCEEEEVKELIMSSNKFFIIKINEVNLTFIVKSIIEADSREVIEFLNKIKKRFSENYAEKMNLPFEKRREIVNKFKDEVKNLLDLGIDYDKILK
jgi:hypothetical protein